MKTYLVKPKETFLVIQFTRFDAETLDTFQHILFTYHIRIQPTGKKFYLQYFLQTYQKTEIQINDYIVLGVTGIFEILSEQALFEKYEQVVI